ncbi:saccharopine dehydrogenase NADP-binding domain-containing protein [Cupriavidus necator]|uniref:saccharopine dehydrogenase NADP-binding domain-containing protein n=1 Tax=Cupriavidus necator TaxID=106590 RepID=UPI002E77B86B|nr:saccharopine dehydrogenase NADP-binding domain-containing protein [Cupriavidus necator]
MIEQIVIIGFGCIGQAVLPLLERTWPQAAITVVDRGAGRRPAATSSHNTRWKRSTPPSRQATSNRCSARCCGPALSC